MTSRNRSLSHRFLRSARPTSLLLFILSALFACSSDESSVVLNRTASTGTASPFARLVDPGGCVIEQITAADYDEYQVQGASADGRLLAMAGRREVKDDGDTTYEAYEIDLATGDKTDLSHALTNSGSYSPDGNYIVVAQETGDGKTDIFEFERATGELNAVAAHEEWDWLPSYSPDGRFIAFNSYRADGQSDVYVFERSTGELTRVTDYPDYDAHAQFSPDGKKLLFHRQHGTRDEGGYIFDLVVYDMESGHETRLTDGPFEESYPAWAPDGRHIVFSSDVDGDHGKLNLYVLAPNGETMARLTLGDWTDRYAFWSRDGKYIYFNSDRTGASNIFRVLMDGVDCVREID